MAQPFRNPKLNSKQPHDGSQSSTIGSDVLGYGGIIKVNTIYMYNINKSF